MCALAEVARVGRLDEVGSCCRSARARTREPIPYEQARDWGQLEWARPILDVVFDGVADTVDFQAAQILRPDRYVRLQTDLRVASDALDDASPRNMAALREEGARLLRDNAAAVDALAERLSQPAARPPAARSRPDAGTPT